MSKAVRLQYTGKMEAFAETDYYFKKWYLKCPCCKGMLRHGTRNRKDQHQITRIE